MYLPKVKGKMGVKSGCAFPVGTGIYRELCCHEKFIAVITIVINHNNNTFQLIMALFLGLLFFSSSSTVGSANKCE